MMVSIVCVCDYCNLQKNKIFPLLIISFASYTHTASNNSYEPKISDVVFNPSRNISSYITVYYIVLLNAVPNRCVLQDH